MKEFESIEAFYKEAITKIQKLKEQKESGKDVDEEIHEYLIQRLRKLTDLQITILQNLNSYAYTLDILLEALKIDSHKPDGIEAIAVRTTQQFMEVIEEVKASVVHDLERYIKNHSRVTRRSRLKRQRQKARRKPEETNETS